MNNELLLDQYHATKDKHYYDNNVLPFLLHGKVQFSNNTGKGKVLDITPSLLSYLKDFTINLYCDIDNGLTLQGNDNEITDYYSSDKQLDFIREVSNILNNKSNGLYIKGTVNLHYFILLQGLLD